MGYLISYILYFFVPILIICGLKSGKMMSLIVGFCGINIIVKIIVMVVLLTSGWKHIGMCYIGGSIKSTIIASSVSEMLILIILIWLMNRKKEILRLEKIIKDFQERSGAKEIPSAWSWDWPTLKSIEVTLEKYFVFQI